MKSIPKLKEQARAHEQKEEWERAIETYREVLRLGEEQEGEMELALFNKVGDLFLRLGRSDDAVEQYQEAADRYAEAGLYNNAIALCNKALRYAPGQVEVYRRLGRFCAAQGFLADARRWILEYAERMNAAGKLEEAFAALEEFADLTNDPEIGEMLGRQLHAHGRTDEAVAQLRRAFRQYADAGKHERAEAVRAALATIAPGLGVEDEPEPARGRAARPPEPDFEEEAYAEPAHPPESTEPLPLLDTSEVGTPTAGPAVPSIRESEPAEEAGDYDDFGMVDIGIESTAEAAGLAGADVPTPDSFGAIPLEGFESTSLAPEEEAVAPLPGLEDAGLPEEGEAEEPEPLPLLGEEDEEAAEPLPLLHEEEAAGGDEDRDLGLLDLGTAMDMGAATEETETGAPAEALPGFELPSFEEAPPPPAPVGVDAGAVMARARQVLARGDRERALGELSGLHVTLAEEGRLADALDVVSEMITIDPSDIRNYQQKVEYAARTAESPRLVSAYLELAGALERRGARTKSQAVLQRVLDLDPGNAQARDALYGGASVRAKEFVDLTAFLGEDADGGREATRFVVAAKAPSGDEEADLAEMLSQFRAKVADNVSVEDAASHYDLGLAFKEMGLVDEAITEFQTALRGGEELLKVYEELGHCFMLKGQFNVAVKVLGRALHLPREEEGELLGVWYHLGRAYEELGQRSEAREAYERVVALDHAFRDVPERLARL